jgi:hypothetical protein
MRLAETWVRRSDRSRGLRSVVSVGWWTDHPSAGSGVRTAAKSSFGRLRDRWIGRTSVARAPEATGQGVLCAHRLRSWPPGASLDALPLLPSPRAARRREAQCAGCGAARGQTPFADGVRRPLRLRKGSDPAPTAVLSAARAARRRLGAAARLGAKTVCMRAAPTHITRKAPLAPALRTERANK